MKQNTQKGKGKRIERKRKASLICPWFACSGPPWPFHLGASCPARPPAWYNITGWGRQQRQSRFHCGFSWFSFKIKKSFLSTQIPKCSSWRWGGSPSCHFFSFSPPQALLSFQGKICWCNCFSAVAQSSSLNEIDERSGSRCYHKVMITWWIIMVITWPGLVIWWWSSGDQLLICWWRNLPKNACSTFTSPPPTVCDGECGEASAQLLQALHKGGSMPIYIAAINIKCY